jgi:hypothetical protein
MLVILLDLLLLRPAAYRHVLFNRLGEAGINYTKLFALYLCFNVCMFHQRATTCKLLVCSCL